MLPSAVTSILLHRDSGLLAAICDDLVTRIVDIETRKIVRELKGSRGRVLDVVRGPIFGSKTLGVSSECCRLSRQTPDGWLQHLLTPSSAHLMSPQGG